MHEDTRRQLCFCRLVCCPNVHNGRLIYRLQVGQACQTTRELSVESHHLVVNVQSSISEDCGAHLVSRKDGLCSVETGWCKRPVGRAALSAQLQCGSSGARVYMYASSRNR
jgi:hypothetical protein